MVTDVPSYYRLSRKLRDGTLTEGENLEHVEDLDETNFDEDAVGYQAELQAEVLSVVEQIEVDQWVIVLYDQQWYPGCVDGRGTRRRARPRRRKQRPGHAR